MPYSNIQYLAQPNPYLLTDPCTITCSLSYTGDFCLDQTPLFSKLPMGPWNQPCYYTVGSGTLRTMSIDVSGINSIQFTARDSLLIGIQAATNSVVEIALYSRTITPVLTAPAGGSYDSLVVRNCIVYTARTTQSGGSSYTYSIGALNDSYSFTQLVSSLPRQGHSDHVRLRSRSHQRTLPGRHALRLGDRGGCDGPGMRGGLPHGGLRQRGHQAA
jgi:hypothetical protein